MLRTRLSISLLPVAIIVLAMGVGAIAVSKRGKASVDHFVGAHYQGILDAQSMSQALTGMEREMQFAAVTRSTDNRLFKEYQNRFEEFLSLQRTRPIKSAEILPLNDELATNYAAFIKNIGAMGVLRAPKDLEQEQVFASSIARMNALLERMRDINIKAVVDDTDAGLNKMGDQLTEVMVAASIIAMIMCLYTGYQLSRSIVQPVQLLTRATRELGEGHSAQPVPIVTRDEVGELANSFNKMLAQLTEYRRSTSDEIVRLHRTMETTLASFPDPIFVLDEDGHIGLRNPAAEDLASALRLNGGLPERLESIARKALDSGQNYLPHSYDEAVSFRFNGADKSYLPRVLAMRSKENALCGVAVVLYDVTRFRLLDSAKSNLVATVSHELNTPLTSLLMALHLLLEESVGRLTPKQGVLLQAAREDTERLLRILNDLLDLARLEQGDEGLHREMVAPGELLRTVIKETADKISARGLRMNCAIEPNLPQVSVDRQRISHVFNNLIANAIKYSPDHGEILLSVARLGDGFVEFCITDQGPGIPEEIHSRIFDRFFRAPGQTKTGAGLGLSIAREITTAHGGRISVRSILGKGSTFCVALKPVE